LRMLLNELSSASRHRSANDGRSGGVNRLRSLRRMNACIRCLSLRLRVCWTLVTPGECKQGEARASSVQGQSATVETSFVPTTCRRSHTQSPITLYTKLDAECVQRVTVVGRLLTVVCHVHRRQVLSTTGNTFLLLQSAMVDMAKFSNYTEFQMLQMDMP